MITKQLEEARDEQMLEECKYSKDRRHHFQFAHWCYCDPPCVDNVHRRCETCGVCEINYTEGEQEYGYIVYWRMQNGHEHSFYTCKLEWRDDSNVPSGYYFRDGREVMTQGDYFDYVKESEQTDEEEIVETDDFREALECGYITAYDEESGEVECI